MRGVVFLGDKELELRTFEDPEPGPGEVVIEMKASGMCGTDLKFYRAPKGFGVLESLGASCPTGDAVISGHEPCGVVVAVGADVGPLVAKVGDRVMVHHYLGCTMCNHCRSGWSQMCDVMPIVAYGFTAHGGHAPYMKAPAITLVKLPDEVSFAAGAALACGSGTAYQGLCRLDLSARDSIAIFGQGPVGASATQFAAAMGAEVIAVDINPSRLEFGKRMGATHVIDSTKVDPVESIMALTRGKGVSRAMDASGTAEGRSAAIRSAAAWGCVAFVGEGGDVTIDVSRDVNRKQLNILGSHTFSTKGLSECAQFVADRQVDVEKLFTSRYALEDAAEAYRTFDKGEGGKGVFVF